METTNLRSKWSAIAKKDSKAIHPSCVNLLLETRIERSQFPESIGKIGYSTGILDRSRPIEGHRDRFMERLGPTRVVEVWDKGKLVWSAV